MATKQKSLPNVSENSERRDEHTPLSASFNFRQTCTPDVASVPRSSTFIQRYRSPTDMMVSPVSRGLLAMNRKPAVIPFAAQSKDSGAAAVNGVAEAGDDADGGGDDLLPL